MSTMLQAFSDRNDAHAFQASVLGNGDYPLAECREDPNSAAPYQVWSGPRQPEETQE